MNKLQQLIPQQEKNLADSEKKLRALLDLHNVAPVVRNNARWCDFSFIFFSDANSADDQNKYRLVFDLAEFADNNGFKAIWLPERHFHPFGGIYPDPAVLAAALAMRTKQVRLRSGSVVLPLHHPTEVVESWSMVDNLSNGRVDLGLASGWNPNDFILSPATFPNHRDVWHERIKILQKLWCGEAQSFVNGNGQETAVNVYPTPKQSQLNIWLTATKLDESFIYAGTMGYNILTMLQGIDLDEMARKISLYRQARQDAGFDPHTGEVTLMLHTLIHKNIETVANAVREPFQAYIKSALIGHMNTVEKDKRPSEQELNKMVEYSFERYFKTGALFGSVDDGKKMVAKTVAAGVTEIACLMDFGVPHTQVMESLPYLQELQVHIQTMQRKPRSLAEASA